MLDEAVTVRAEPPPAVTELGLSVAVRPAGAVTDNEIVSAVPVTSAVAMLLVPAAPCTTAKLFGLAEIEKSEAFAVTFTATDTLCVMEPSTPVTVTVYGPGATVADAVTVRIESLPAPTTVLPSVADIPTGDDTDSETGPANPVTSAVVMSLVTLKPWGTLTLAGLAEIEKSPLAKTVMWTTAKWKTGPSVPTTFIP
jgi:hypothetical protein